MLDLEEHQRFIKNRGDYIKLVPTGCASERIIPR